MSDFQRQFSKLLSNIWYDGQEVEVGEWQSQDVRDKPEMISRELRHVTFKLKVWDTIELLQKDVSPNLPWAEDHFLERVSGEPLNPPPSEAWWPYAVQSNSAHKEGELFSHTYPERMWPKDAGWPKGPFQYWTKDLNRGVRYALGDLSDVVAQLTKNPLTRQAYLPIWFPEDTGARSNQRVPCTLGYHFLIRNGRCEIVYYIRSCDLLRHFTDDVYMACRLLQWVVRKLQGNGIDVKVDSLIMYISSLHVFRGDYTVIGHMMRENREKLEEDIYGAAI